MNRIYSKTRLAWLIVLACAVCSCAQDPAERSGGDGSGAVPLMLNVIVPDHNSAATRAIAGTQENTIQTLDLLVFKIEGTSETFDYSTQGALAANNTAGAATQTFTATLHPQSYQQRIVVITNARTEVATLLGSSTWKGADKTAMLAGLKYNLGSADRWNATSASSFTAMPMWGESAAETITNSTRTLSTAVQLMRMVARIDVQLDTSVSGLTNQFKLKSVNLYNTNTGGNIVPDKAKVVDTEQSGARYLYVNAPTIPAELQPYSARKLGPIAYADFTAPGVTDVSMIGAIYTFETAADTADTQATCIVVGGLYGTDTTPSYYRVEFYAAGTSNRLNILRNHRYVINIRSVQGRGYATPTEAFSSRAVNMTANVLVWNQPGIDNIAFDGQNTLATNKDRMTLFSNEYTNASPTGDNAMTVFTDVPAGWTVQSIVSASDGTTPVTWLSLNPAAGATNTTTNTAVSAQANNTGANRSAIINLAAGRLRMPIYVTQTTQPAISLTIMNSQNTQEIQELVFSGGAGVTPDPQSFTVNWLPATNPVDIVANQIATYEFPNPGGNPAVQDGAPQTGQITSASGTTSYTVRPPALTASEIAANPFMQKASRFDFTVGNGFTTMTKSIILRQLNYNLVVEKSSTNGTSSTPADPLTGSLYAQLGGRQFTYNVRSNSAWRINNVAETRQVDTGVSLIGARSNGDNVYTGAAGVANTTPGGGFKELFHTDNTRRGNSGYADVTYESVPSGRFTSVTQRIFFPSAQFTIYGLVKMNDSNAHFYNIFAGTNNQQNTASSRTNHIHTLIKTESNYGSQLSGSGNAATPSSTVFTSPVNINGNNINSGSAITVAEINQAVNSGADMLFISGSSTFGDDVATIIRDQFLYKDKPVFLAIEDAASFIALWKIIGGGGERLWNSNSSLNGNAPVYQFQSPSGDPIVANGKFGGLNSYFWGCDGTGSVAYWFTNDAGNTHTTTNMVVYSNARNQSGNTDSPPTGTNFSNQTMDNGYTCFRFTHVPLIFAADGGFAGCFNQTDSTRGPCLINESTGKPAMRGSYGGGNTKRDCTNSYFMASAIAWAIQRRTTQ